MAWVLSLYWQNPLQEKLKTAFLGSDMAHLGHIMISGLSQIKMTVKLEEIFFYVL